MSGEILHGAMMTSQTEQRYQTSKTIVGAFHLTEDNIKKIASLCRDFTGERVYVKFVFDGEEESYTVSDFSGDLNHPSLRYFHVEQIYFISGNQGDKRRYVSISLHKSSPIIASLCLIRIEGDFDAVNALKIAVSHEVSALSSSYSWIYSKYVTTAVGGMAGLLVGNLLTRTFKLEDIWKSLKAGSYQDFLISIILFCLCVFGIISVIAQSKSRLFPIFVVSVGAGLERNKRVAAFRNVILVGVILSLVVSLLGSYIYGKLDTPQTLTTQTK